MKWVNQEIKKEIKKYMADFKLYYKAVIIKTYCLHKNRHMDQWNRIENPEMDPQMYGQPMFNKAGKNSQWNRDGLFSKWCWENWTATCRRMNLDYPLIPYTKVSSKWIKDLNVRHETIKILEEKTGNNIFDLICSNFLLDISQEAWQTKAKMNYWDLIKIKSFCTATEIISKTKRQPMEWKKIFANDISDKGLVSKIYK